MDRLAALQVFRAVVEQGSLAAAARRLRLSPAAVSKSIAALETALAVRLLNRTTRRMSLTEAGALYYARIGPILDELAETDRGLGRLQDSPSGLLRVAAPMTLTLVALAPVLPDFLKRYPGLSLDLNLDDRRVDLLREGYDLAIRGSDRLEDSSLIARRLMTLTHVVCAAPDYWARQGRPRRPEDLAGHECVRFSLSGHADSWPFTRGRESVSVAAGGRYSASSSLAVLEALKAGFGLSLIPWLYVRAEVEAGRLQVVLADWSAVETAIYAVYPAGRHPLPKVRAFVDFLVETLGRDTP